MGRAATAPARPARQPQRAPRPRPMVVQRRRRRARFRLRLGLATIPLVALLFAGVVYVNSAELKVTKRQGQIVRQSALVQEEIAQYKATQARKDVKVASQAQTYGMVLPGSDQLRFVRARPLDP